MNPAILNISDYCSGINSTDSCGLLVRNLGFKVRCRFVSCSEKHVYACSKAIQVLHKNIEPTKGDNKYQGLNDFTINSRSIKQQVV